VTLLIQVATTWAMTGIIWFVQLVQYPSFAQVDPTSFQAFHAHHSSAISFIMAPLMVLEALSAFAFLWAPLRVQSSWQIWLGIGLVIVIWASTILLQVPAHSRLGSGFDEDSWRLLVSSNWVRTVAWSARAGLVTYWLYETLAAGKRLGV
jgi:multidrug transporter EmrE-like cation transporter